MRQYILIFSLSIFINFTVFGQSAEGYYKKASDFYDKGDYDNAVINVNKALQADSINVNYLLLKGNAFAMENKILDAFDAYTLAINSNPGNSYVYNQRGLLLMNIQEANYAISDFSAALNFEEVDSIKLTLFLNRGVAKVNMRDFQGAYDDFIAALKFDTLNIGALNNLASVCDEVGKGEQTLPYLFKIVKIDSTFAGAYGNIGFKYQEMGDYKTAIKYFNKVLELQPDAPLGYSNRAYNRYKLGDYKGALSDINLSIKLYPTNSYAYRNRALIYLAENDKLKACVDISEALRLGFTKMYGEEIEQLKAQHCK